MNEKFDKKLDNYVWNSRIPYKFCGINQIFLGKDLLHERPALIKVLPIIQFTDEYLLNNLLQDWQKIKSLKSPFLCETYDILLTKNNLYIFEEYHPQGSLKQYIKENSKEKIHEKTFGFLNDIIKGLEILYSDGIVHGDLKLENLIISNCMIKINDFAFKNRLVRKNPNHTYQSPEQLAKKPGFLSSKTDIWAIGCILYELITGKIPYFGLTEFEMMESFNKEVIFSEEIEKNPNIKEFIEGTINIDIEKRWTINQIVNSSLLTMLREKDSKSKASLHDMDYNSKLILMNLEQTIRKNKLDITALFQRFDSSGDQTIDLKEFMSLLKIVDSKLSVLQIENVFNLIDYDGSGSISLEELKELMGLKREEENKFVENQEMELKIKKTMYVLKETIKRNGLDINAIFSRYDNSGDMNLDAEEFFSLLKDITPSIEEEIVKYLFRKLDFDGSGDININEFKCYVLEDTAMQRKLKELEEKTQETIQSLRNMLYGQKLDMRKLFAKADKKDRGKINEEEFGELIEVLDDGIKKDVINHFFKKIDKDGSGFIDYEEFVEYLK